MFGSYGVPATQINTVLYIGFVPDVYIKYINNSKSCMVPKVSQRLKSILFMYEFVPMLYIEYINTTKSCLVPKVYTIIHCGMLQWLFLLLRLCGF